MLNKSEILLPFSIKSFWALFEKVKITKQYPNIYTIIILLIIDINLFLLSNKFDMIITGLSLPIVIAISYYKLFPKNIKRAIPYLIGLLIIVGIFLINEKNKLWKYDEICKITI